MLIDWFTVAAQIINFLILLGLLKYFLFGRIVAAMNNREKAIASRLEAAECKRGEAAELERAYRLEKERLEQGREDILARAREEAEAARNRLIDNTRHEVGELELRWREALEQQQEAFLQELRQLSYRQVFSTVRRALEDLGNEELERQVIQVFLQRLEHGADETWEAIRQATNGAPGALVIQSAFEIPGPWRERISAMVRERLGGHAGVEFDTVPTVVCGIELRARGYKIAWSFDSYLAELEERMGLAVAEEARKTAGSQGSE